MQIENQEAPYYALTATLDNTPRQQKNHLHLLSPFDNITIDRDRLLDLFDFHYRIECYTPAPKRQYGYFTLPILWNGSFIGRLDPKAERKSQTFLVRNIVFEPGFKDYDALLPALAKALHRFAAFNGCTSIRVERTKPSKTKPARIAAKPSDITSPTHRKGIIVKLLVDSAFKRAETFIRDKGPPRLRIFINGGYIPHSPIYSKTAGPCSIL